MKRVFKSGYIGIVGRPNVGKSTLLNLLVGQKIAAVTEKPQTTRHRILGIRTLPEGQLLFIDTPGIHRPHKNLNEYMMQVTRAALEDVDLFLFLVEPTPRILGEDRRIYEMLSDKRKPVLLIINKVDTVSKDSLLPLISRYHEDWKPVAVVPFCALEENGLENLQQEILRYLPEGPPYYPEDQVSDLSERFIASEVIREKVTLLTREEVPYSVAVEIESYEEPKEADVKKVVRIRASIVVEKDSQKGILVGKGGSMIKKIGQEARLEMEKRLGTKVFLELFVRVEEGWTKDPRKLKELGYF
ncbi:MAG: GTPase Era [Deltaproteobacteria bacterium]|nr:GTPase Era [Deltaproteobacteria bacterium]